MFPLQIGGLLVNNLDCEINNFDLPGIALKRYIQNVLSLHIQTEDKIIKKRLANYNYLSDKFKEIGFIERIKPENETVPGVFMFRKGRHQIDLHDLKRYYTKHGIQCSVFYGEESFFIPVHQALNEHDLDYFVEVMKSFLQETTK